MIRAVCADAEKLVLKQIMSLCGKIAELDEVEGFTGSEEALGYIGENRTDVALLDINMPDMN